MMSIGTYVCGSCAVGSISNLGSHTDAVSAMATFCKQQLGTKDKFAHDFKYAKLINFYVFCAGPEVPANHPNGSHHSKDWVKYGTEFAAFLVEQELGEVVTLGPKFNAKHHPSTTAQVWVWSPNQIAVEKWWEDYQAPKQVKSIKDTNLPCGI